MVAVIESITSHREPQPQFEAMYLLMSTSQNVERIIRDFANGHQQYAAAHLFFVDGVCFLCDWLCGLCGHGEGLTYRGSSGRTSV